MITYAHVESCLIVGLHADTLTAQDGICDMLAYRATAQIQVQNWRRYVDSRVDHQFLPLHRAEQCDRVMDTTDHTDHKIVVQCRLKRPSGKIIAEVHL